MFGLTVAMTGMTAVFIGLAVVYGVMILSTRLSDGPKRKKNRPREAAAAEKTATCVAPEVSAEVAHAIALALFMDLRILDEASSEDVTIRRITKAYSPWWHSGQNMLMTDVQKVFDRQSSR